MDIHEMYQMLTGIRLFQGINGMNLARLEERVQLNISSRQQSQGTFIKQNTVCISLDFLIEGSLIRSFKDPEGRYEVCQEVNHPFAIEPESLFGLHCLYTFSYSPMGQCMMLSIPKTDVTHTLIKEDIFRINYLNLMASQVKKLEQLNLKTPLDNFHDKFVHLIRRHTMDQRGEITLIARLQDIATLCAETRLTTSNELNKMEEQGLIEMKRCQIIIPDLDKL